MEFTAFVGVDVSKNTLDLALIKNGKHVESWQIANNKTAISKWLTSLFSFSQQKGISKDQLLFCLETTGTYGLPLLKALYELGLAAWEENAFTIKRAMDTRRGKSDAADAVQIALYASRFQDRFMPWQPLSDQLKALKAQAGYRAQLVKQRAALKQRIKACKSHDPEAYQQLRQQNLALIQDLDKHIKQTEDKMRAIVSSCKRLKKQMAYITSVPGVGEVTAWKIVVVTKGFTRLTDPKKLACYAGVVPFQHQSGLFRGKQKVSPMANKDLKQALHMCALAVVSKPSEFREFFERKLEQGKNKMSIINAIRNRILSRILACVRDQRKYQNSYQTTLD